MSGTSKVLVDVTIVKAEISYSTFRYRIRMWKTLNETFSDGKQGDWVIFKFLKAGVKLYVYIKSPCRISFN